MVWDVWKYVCPLRINERLRFMHSFKNTTSEHNRLCLSDSELFSLYISLYMILVFKTFVVDLTFAPPQ